MNKLFIVLLMMFCHIVDDYYLQGWLASAKQKKYWQDYAPDNMYKYDYLWALIIYSFSWSFMIMLPIAFARCFNVGLPFLIVLICNMVIHALVDNLKANEKKINLWVDQIIHLVQIALTVQMLL